MAKSKSSSKAVSSKTAASFSEVLYVLRDELEQAREDGKERDLKFDWVRSGWCAVTRRF